MTPKIDYTDYAALRILAIKYALSHGLWDEQLAEDFAQEYCLAVWRKQTRSLKLQLTNFLRKYFGRTGKRATADSLAKSFALRTMKSYQEE